MFCSQCGIKIKDDAKFCPACGAKIGDDDTEKNEVVQTEVVAEKTAAFNNESADTTVEPVNKPDEQVVYCMYCGGKNNANDTICSFCGKQRTDRISKKSRLTAAILAGTLGMVGAHRIYLGIKLSGALQAFLVLLSLLLVVVLGENGFICAVIILPILLIWVLADFISILSGKMEDGKGNKVVMWNDKRYCEHCGTPIGMDFKFCMKCKNEIDWKDKQGDAK